MYISMKNSIIRIILILFCIYTVRIVAANFVIDYYGYPDISSITTTLQTEKYYYTGTSIFIVSSGTLDYFSKRWWFATWDGSWSAKAFAFGPIIGLRFHDHPMNSIWINHELIHQTQCIKTFCLLHLFSKGEYRWYRRQWYSHMDAYLMKSTEQEAYLNQHNMQYLTNHHIVDSLKYITKKVSIIFDDSYKVINNSKL